MPNKEQSTETTERPVIHCEPPFEFRRNEYNLFSHINYEFNEDGTVNWRKMIPNEFLVVNKENFERRNQVPPTSIEGLEDKDLIILLGGIKYLARLRGYNSVNHLPTLTTPNYVGVRTVINWIGNYETDGRTIMFESWADAHPHNVGERMRPYLATIAENRGFVRAVRNFLGINIVGQEELGVGVKEITESTTGKPVEGLERLLASNGIKFEAFVNRMTSEGIEGASDWRDFNDIPTELVFELIEKTNQRLEEKRKLSKKS